MSNQSNQSTVKVFLGNLDRVAYFLIAALIFECAIGSSGRLISFGPVSLRMLLFALAFLVTLPAVFINIKILVKDRTMIATLIFLLYLFISFVLGFTRNHPPGFVISDLTGLLFLVLLPGFVVTISSKKRILTLAKVLLLGATILAAAILTIHYILIFNPSTDKYINDFLNGHSLGGLFFLGQFIFRIYLRSSMFNLCGIMIGIYFYFRNSSNTWERITIGRKTAALVIVLNVYALLLTYTRSLWFGLFFALLFLLLIFRPNARRLLSALSATAAGLLILTTITIFSCGNLAVISKGVERVSLGLASHLNITLFERDFDDWNTSIEEKNAHKVMEKADQLRSKTKEALITRIGQKPLFGSGLGQNLDEIGRTDGKAEYTYLDIAMKMGLVGLLLFFLPIIFLFVKYIQCIKELRKNSADQESKDFLNLLHAFMACLLGVMLVSYFNPFISNPLGLSIYLLCVACLYSYIQSLKQEQAQEV